MGASLVAQTVKNLPATQETWVQSLGPLENTNTCWGKTENMVSGGARIPEVKVDQSYPTLWDPMDYTVHRILQARKPEQVAFFFSRGSSQPRDRTHPHCRQIFYELSHKGSPRILEWVTYPFSSGSSWPRNRTQVSCTTGRCFTDWATREAPTF